MHDYAIAGNQLVFGGHDERADEGQVATWRRRQVALVIGGQDRGHGSRARPSTSANYFSQDRFQIGTASGPQIMARLRDLAITISG